MSDISTMNFIPLENKRKPSFDFMNMSSKKRQRVNPLSFGGDTRILPRIKELIDSDVLHFIDEDQLLTDLQNTYPEYRRKRKCDLKAAINKAIDLHMADGRNSRGGSQQNFADNSETSGKDVMSEDANVSRIVGCKEYLQEQEISSPQIKCTQNVVRVNDANSPVIYGKEIKRIVTKNSRQESDIKNSEVEKSQKTPRSFKQQGKIDIIPQYPTERFSDIGGQEDIVKAVWKILWPFKFPEIYTSQQMKFPCGILLHGLPGCGKTLLVRAIAGELGVPLIQVAATKLVSGISGDSEEKIRLLFEQATNSSPCILFIDEIDAITPKRDSSLKDMEKRIVSQLLVSMNELSTKDISSRVLVVGATNRPDSLDPALRREGRFEREINMPIPDIEARIRILKVVSQNWRLSPDFDFRGLAQNTPGYVGADLTALGALATDFAFEREFSKLDFMTATNLKENESTEDCRESCSDNISEWAKLSAIMSMSDDDRKLLMDKLLPEFVIKVEDFQMAIETYVPSLKREGFATVCTALPNDAGALDDVQESLRRHIVWPVKYKRVCDKMKLRSASGVLLWGPKGCGKTLLAKIAARENGLNFLSVKGPELLSMYVGESEGAIRRVFQRARNCAPCVILFDELDALGQSRWNSAENGPKVVHQLLTELDGMESRRQVFVMGTTNRLDNIDPALLRPGRMDVVEYVGLPKPQGRIEILKAQTKNGTEPKFAADVNIEALALDNRCKFFSGADLASLIRHASTEALKDYIERNETDDGNIELSLAHFEYAFSKVKRSVSKQEMKYFKEMREETKKKSVT